MPVSLRSAVLCVCLLGAGFLLSQTIGAGKTDLLQAYAQADKIYRAAVGISNRKNAAEAVEDSLNRLALKRFSSLYQTLQHTPIGLDSLLFFVSFKVGELHHYFGDEKEALQYYTTAIAAKQKAVLADSFLFKPYLFKGIILYNQNRFDSALYFFEAAEKVQQAYPRVLTENQRLYNSLGALYFATGNYSTAKIYFQKALDVLSRTNPYYRELLVNYNINLASSHVMLEEYAEANTIYQRLIPLGLNLNEIYHNLGLINLNLGVPQKAISFFQKVSYGSNRIVRLYNDWGFAYFNLQQFDSARVYYLKALQTAPVFSAGLPTVSLGLTLHYLGKLANAINLPDSALWYYNEAIHQFYPAYSSKDAMANPQQFSGVFSYINLFSVFVDKAATLDRLYQTTKKPAWLDAELASFEAAFSLVDYVEKTYNSDEARLFLGKIKYTIHNRPIDVALELYGLTGNRKYFERAYRLDQKNKASVLVYNIQLNKANLSSPLVQEEKRLRTEITRLSLKALQLPTTDERAEISTEIRNDEILLSRLQERLSAKSPSAVTNIPTIATLQKDLLDPNTALYSYHLSDTILTVFRVTKTDFDVVRKRIDTVFRSDVTNLLNHLETAETDTGDDVRYRRLYTYLLKKNEEKERLIFIPEDELAALPFEIVKDGNNRFLIETHSVQYQYATALLKKETTDFTHASTLAFAPFAASAVAADDLRFAQLPFSGKEFGADQTNVFLNGAATKSAFLANVQKPAILHFATHAAVNKTNNELSYIAFSPQAGHDKNDYLLYEKEIADLSLPQTRLVILSACETGAGKLVKGEGMRSLSRAFAYAGCPNTITSIWKAADVSTSYLVKQIHANLASGASIDRAIQQAKKTYLADGSINPRLKAPSYWAHLVFIGNYAPQKPVLPVWMVVIGSLLLIAIVLVVMKLFARKANRKP